MVEFVVIDREHPRLAELLLQEAPRFGDSQEIPGRPRLAPFPPRTLGQGLVRQVDRVEVGHTID